MDFRGWLQSDPNKAWALDYAGNDVDFNSGGGINFDKINALSEGAGSIVSPSNPNGIPAYGYGTATNYTPGVDDTILQYWSDYIGGSGEGKVLGATTSGSKPSYSQADIDKLNGQESRYRRLYDDSNTLETNALTALGLSYDSELGALNTDKTRKEEDFNDSTYKSEQGRQRSQNSVDTNSRTLAESLQRVLGMASGTGSSAYKFAAPRAVGRVRSEGTGDVMSAFSDNANELQRFKNRYEEDYTTAREELDTSKTQKTKDIQTGFQRERQNLNDYLSQIAVDRAGIMGGNTAAAMQPYESAYNALQNSIVGLSAPTASSVKARGLSVDPLQLRDYVTNRVGINKQASSAFGNDQSIYKVFKDEEDEQARV